MKLTTNDLEFIKFVKRECRRTKIKCIFKNTKSVKLSEENNTRCSGYFDSENRELVVAMKHPQALAIIVHEYCHLTQWEEQIPLWKKADIALIKIDDWLNGKRIHNIRQHLSIARNLELDNEKRSVQTIRKWKLSIDLDLYIKRANAYIHFYNYLYYSRSWSKPSNTPYTNKRIVRLMSSRFNMKYDDLSPKIHKIFTDENIGF